MLISFSSRYVARDAGKETMTISLKFTERKLQREFSAALVQAGKFDCFPGDVFLSGGYIVSQPAR